jgi:serine/threonine-protein kinase RsbT
LDIAVSSISDAEHARRQAHLMARSLGFESHLEEVITLAVSELAMNLVRYSKNGRITLSETRGPRGVGIQVESHDDGPGIADVGLAMQDGYSTSGGMGSGLPSVKRLMDDFAMTTGDSGTSIVACKWTSQL